MVETDLESVKEQLCDLKVSFRGNLRTQAAQKLNGLLSKRVGSGFIHSTFFSLCDVLYYNVRNISNDFSKCPQYVFSLLFLSGI